MQADHPDSKTCQEPGLAPRVPTSQGSKRNGWKEITPNLEIPKAQECQNRASKKFSEETTELSLKDKMYKTRRFETVPHGVNGNW